MLFSISVAAASSNTVSLAVPKCPLRSLPSYLRISDYIRMINSFMRALYLGYFISHIPITLCVDMQALFGQYYPEPLRNLFAWYSSTYHDVLMAPPSPIWLQSFITCEVFLQLPFFFYATRALWNRDNSIRVPMIIYGTHVATTVLPILAELLHSPELTASEVMILLSFYVPYLLIPLALVYDFSSSAEPLAPLKKTE